MKYKEWNEQRIKDVNDFVNANCIFAFGPEQLKQALKEHNLTEEQFQAEYVAFYGGGAIREDKVKEYESMSQRHFDDLQEKMKDFDFAYSAFYYELSNHEYGYTYDETDALIDLGLTPKQIAENQILNRAFCKAAQEVKNQD